MSVSDPRIISVQATVFLVPKFFSISICKKIISVTVFSFLVKISKLIFQNKHVVVGKSRKWNLNTIKYKRKVYHCNVINEQFD